MVNFDNIKLINNNEMKSRSTLFLLLITGMAAFSYACTSKNEKTETDNKNDAAAAEIVEILKTEKEPVTRNIELTSALTPFEEVHLAPAAPGRIEKITVDISDFVKQGTLLVIMDQTQLQQAEVNLLTVATDYKRLDTLKKSGSIAEQQYDQIKARYDVAKSNYEFLLKNTRLTAPFDGVISGKYFEDGEMYSGSPVPAVGKAAVLSIVQISNLKAFLRLSAKYFP
jgi:multidrug efflux pump subunit AcrA (membrane-fusion protein)